MKNLTQLFFLLFSLNSFSQVEIHYNGVQVQNVDYSFEATPTIQKCKMWVHNYDTSPITIHHTITTIDKPQNWQTFSFDPQLSYAHPLDTNYWMSIMPHTIPAMDSMHLEIQISATEEGCGEFKIGIVDEIGNIEAEIDFNAGTYNASCFLSTEQNELPEFIYFNNEINLNNHLSQEVQLNIYNLNAQVVFSESITPYNHFKQNLKAYRDGIYFVHLMINDQVVLRKKIVVSH